MAEKSAYKPLESLPDSVMQPEQVLYLHVLAQALIDASSRDKTMRKGISLWTKHDDFVVVCENAGVNPQVCKKLIAGILRERNKKKAFKKAMSFRFLVRTYINSNRGSIDKDDLEL